MREKGELKNSIIRGERRERRVVVVNGLELLLLMQCKDGNLFFGPLSFPFTLPNFLPFIQAFICYPFHTSIHPIPARGWVGVLVFRCRVVYSACVRATVSFGSVRSRLLGFPISHLWTTCDVFLSWKLTHNSDTDPQMAKLIPFCIFKKVISLCFDLGSP